MKDLEGMVEAEEDESMLSDLQVLQKQALAACTVLQQLSVSGMTHDQTVACYKGQLHDLSLEPVAPNPFPVYLSKSMHQQIAEDTWPAASFFGRSVTIRWCAR